MYNNMNSINWVHGIEGARMWQCVPNSNVVLMDSESEKFYIKSTDNIGMSKLRSFEYKEIIETEKKNQYVTRDELQQILDSLNTKEVKKTTTKKEVMKDE